MSFLNATYINKIKEPIFKLWWAAALNTGLYNGPLVPTNYPKMCKRYYKIPRSHFNKLIEKVKEDVGKSKEMMEIMEKMEGEAENFKTTVTNKSRLKQTEEPLKKGPEVTTKNENKKNNEYFTGAGSGVGTNRKFDHGVQTKNLEATSKVKGRPFVNKEAGQKRQTFEFPEVAGPSTGACEMYNDHLHNVKIECERIKPTKKEQDKQSRSITENKPPDKSSIHLKKEVDHFFNNRTQASVQQSVDNRIKKLDCFWRKESFVTMLNPTKCQLKKSPIKIMHDNSLNPKADCSNQAHKKHKQPQRNRDCNKDKCGQLYVKSNFNSRENKHPRESDTRNSILVCFNQKMPSGNGQHISKSNDSRPYPKMGPILEPFKQMYVNLSEPGSKDQRTAAGEKPGRSEIKPSNQKDGRIAKYSRWGHFSRMLTGKKYSN